MNKLTYPTKSALRGITLLATLALLGCAGQGADTPPTQFAGKSKAAILGQQRLVGPTAAQLAAQRERNRVTLPPGASDALQQLGFLAPSAPTAPGTRMVSTTLPYNLPANQEYNNPGDAGYIGSSSNVLFAPGPPPIGGANFAPAGPNFPDNFSYVIYRVDDVGQLPFSLGLNFGATLPGTQVGVAAYDWAYGSSGRWEPLYYGDAVTLNLPLALIAGADYTNAGDDLAFAVFCLAPNAVQLTDITLDGYDEVEPNDSGPDVPSSIPFAQPLPAFPFSDFLGNVGEGGSYDGGTDDYFSFTGTPGQMYKFTIVFGTPNVSFAASCYDSNANLNSIGVYADQASTDMTVTVLITGDQAQPLVLNLYEFEGSGEFTDYLLSGEEVTTLGEVENNDDNASANVLPGYPFYVNGSLGIPGYDGDLSDNFSFTLNQGETPLLWLIYDPTQAQFDFAGNPPTIRDSGGNPVMMGEDGGINYGAPDMVVFNAIGDYTVLMNDTFYLDINPVFGVTYYWFERYR